MVWFGFIWHGVVCFVSMGPSSEISLRKRDERERQRERERESERSSSLGLVSIWTIMDPLVKHCLLRKSSGG